MKPKHNAELAQAELTEDDLLSFVAGEATSALKKRIAEEMEKDESFSQKWLSRLRSAAADPCNVDWAALLEPGTIAETAEVEEPRLSLERICNQLNRYRLLPAQHIRNLRQNWLRQAGTSGSDPVLFVKWLAYHGYVTDYQVDVLLRRRDDPLVLGRYKLRGHIDRGPMAGVYAAVDPQGQIVAIKVLPPTRAADPAILARFQREARLTVRLHHPNVIRTFEADEQHGFHFLVMELLRGESLEDVLLRRGPLPAAEAIRLIYQALLGLQHVHEQGMIHRDLKPANLMLVPGRADQTDTTLHSTVKILDIGLGRAMFEKGSPESGLVNITATGDQFGTMLYCSPEQSKDPHQADIRSDIYSLGCILYHTLVGQPPFDDGRLDRVRLSHASEPPPRLNISEPPGLQVVLDTMLAKDPALRYPTPGQAAEELRRFLTPK